MHARVAAIFAALALLLCAVEGYDKCTVEPPGKHLAYVSGTDDFCCRTKLTANKFAGCCYQSFCAAANWRIWCYGINSVGSSWAKTGPHWDKATSTYTDCEHNAASVVYVANLAPTASASQEPRVATVGRVAEPDDAPAAAASTPERNNAPTSALGGLFPPGSDPAAKPAVLEALQAKYGGMSTTIDGVALVVDKYVRKGKAIPADIKAGLGRAAKLMKMAANSLDKLGEACGYRCLACFVKRMDTPTPITSCDACDDNVLAFSDC